MKVAVQFIKAWSRYNIGDVAAFEQAQAETLISTRIARKHRQQPKPESETVTLTASLNVEEMPDVKEALAAMDQASQELDRRAAEQEARQAELDRRAADLDQREAKLQAPLSAPAAEVAEDDPQDKPEAEARPKGGLPKQGK